MKRHKWDAKTKATICTRRIQGQVGGRHLFRVSHQSSPV